MNKIDNILSRILLSFILINIAVSAIGQITAYKTNDTEFIYTGGEARHQVIDSIIGYGDYLGRKNCVITKQIKQRDDLGRIKEENSFVINKNGKIIPSISKRNNIDAKGNITESIFYEWDENVDYFFEYMKYVYRYEDNDVCKSYRYYLNSDNLWILRDSSRIQTTYNSNMDPVEITTETFKNGTWVDSLKETYIYDSLCRLQKNETFVWNNTSWNYRSRQSITYNEVGDQNVAEIIEETWNSDQWEQIKFSIGATSIKPNKIIYTTMLYIKKDKELKAAKKRTKGFYINAGENKVTVSIYNAKGELLSSQKIKHTEYVNMDKFGKGLYNIKVTAQNRTVTRKIKID